MTRAKLSLATSFAALLAVSAFAAAPDVAADLKVGVIDPARRTVTIEGQYRRVDDDKTI